MADSVVLSIITSLHYGREIVLGAQSYLRAVGYPQVSLGSPSADAAAHLATRSDVAGIIVTAFSEEVVNAFLNTGKAVVNTSSRCPATRLPSVLPDNIAIGRLAAEHYLQKGFRHYAACGSSDIHFARLRCQGFKDAVTKALPNAQVAEFDNIWGPGLDEWLLSLKRPCGVFAITDHHGMTIVQRCQALGLRVPQDIAVVGVDNDEITCTLAATPLSSVDPNGRQIGFVAGQLLERLIQGQPAKPEPILIQPEGVIARQSSDIMAVEKPDVAAALRYIQDHACDPMQIDKMANFLAVSRRTIERQFKAHFGYTLHDEIRRVRFDRAKQLLLKTSLKVPEIARRCGFMNAKRFSTDFRRFVGTSPSEFRQDVLLPDEQSAR